MRAQDLRIGNWIYEPNNENNNPFQIWGIYHEKGNEKINGYPLSYFRPIPLDEEWLFKFGFKRDKHDYYYRKDVLSYGYILISIVESEISVELLQGNGYPLGRLNIKYVHSLQNLYHALTGEELTLKQ